MTYNGGKNGSGTYQTIINQIPPHKQYIEAFAGSGAILRLKKPAMASIVIDRDASALSKLAMYAGGIPNMTMVHANALDWLVSSNLTSDDFLYCDPPYPFSVRSHKGKLYKYELSDTDHRTLLSTLMASGAKVAISGYHNDIYDEMISDWRKIEYSVVKRNGKRAVEVLWMNYPEPVELHDYSYLGKNFRERERIKRKVQRWKQNLEALHPLERSAILASLTDARYSMLENGER